MDGSAFSLTVGALTFLLAVVGGMPLIRRLRGLTVGATTRHIPADEAEERRFVPTLGGLLIVLPVAAVTLALFGIREVLGTAIGRSLLLPLATLVAFGLIGAIDDWETMRDTRAQGISPRLRLIAQLVVAVGAALMLFFVFDIRSIALPGVDQRFDLGWRYILIATLIVFSMSNAVDLTDGVDGLAGIISTTAFAAYGVVALVQGQIFVAQFCLTVVGAVVGLLWFNIYPAQLRLGDSGAFALGATLGVVALMTGQWLILPIIALMPVLEALSVVVQVAYFQVTRIVSGEGVHLLRATPLHHHYELTGWSQVQIFQRFWVVQLLASTVGVALALL